jgi:hypothetical protein
MVDFRIIFDMASTNGILILVTKQNAKENFALPPNKNLTSTNLHVSSFRYEPLGSYSKWLLVCFLLQTMHVAILLIVIL